jgi:hypothetical protein
MAPKTLLLAVAVVCLPLVGCLPSIKETEPAWAVAQAPDDACLVGAVRSVSELQEALRGLAGPDAGDIDLVKSLEGGVPAGLFDTGGPVVAVLRFAEGKAELVLLLRLKDETKLQGERLEGDIVKVAGPPPPAKAQAPGAAGAGYVKKTGPWAAYSREVGPLKWFAAAPKRLALTDAEAAQVAGRTLWLRVEPKPLAVALKDLIEKQTRGAPGGPPAPPAAKKVFDWMAGVAGQVGRVVVAADVKAEGIAADVAVDLAEGSSLLALAQAGRPAEGLAGSLPASDRLLFAGWGRMDPAKALPPYKALLRPLIDAILEGQGEEARKGADKLWDSFGKWGDVLGGEVAFLLEAAPTGQGMYRVAEVIAVKDPAAYGKLMAEQMDATKGLMSAFMGGMGGPPGLPTPRMDVDWKVAAETIEGIPVDVMRLKATMELPPDSPAEAKAQAADLMALLYGPEGMVVRMGVADRTAVVAIGGADRMAQAIRAARGQGPRLAADPKVAAALGRLPKDASGAVVLSLGNYVHMTMSFVQQMMSANVPPEVKEAAKAEGMDVWAPPPPGDLVTVSGRLDGRTVRIAVGVPQSEVRNAVTVGKEGGKRIAWYAQKQQELMKKQNPGQGGQAAPPAEKKE